MTVFPAAVKARLLRGRLIVLYFTKGRGNGFASCRCRGGLWPRGGRRIQARSLRVMPAMCRPWKRAPSSSFSLGRREPSPPAMVVAP